MTWPPPVYSAFGRSSPAWRAWGWWHPPPPHPHGAPVPSCKKQQLITHKPHIIPNHRRQAKSVLKIRQHASSDFPLTLWFSVLESGERSSVSVLWRAERLGPTLRLATDTLLPALSSHQHSLYLE